MDLQEYLAQFGPVDAVPTSNFQRVVAKRLAASWASVPLVTHHDDVDVTALEAYRQEFAKTKRISPLPFLVKALASALHSFPHFNSSLSEDGKQLLKKSYFHIGVAVDGPLGLLVPVIKDVDQKSVETVAEELSDVARRAREKGLPPSEMEGGCMTISSLGGIGGTAFTPLVNLPEVAILGVTATRMTPHWNGEGFEPRPMMPLSLSYDHRVINGADAARFIRHIGSSLAAPAQL